MTGVNRIVGYLDVIVVHFYKMRSFFSCFAISLSKTKSITFPFLLYYLLLICRLGITKEYGKKNYLSGYQVLFYGFQVDIEVHTQPDFKVLLMRYQIYLKRF